MPNIRKHLLKIVGPIIFLVLLTQIDLGQFIGGLKKTNVTLFLLSLPLTWISTFFKSLRWRSLIKAGAGDGFVHVPVGECLWEYFRSIFWGAATPGRIGEFSKIRYVTEHGGGLGKAIATVLGDRLFDLAALVMVALLYAGNLAPNLGMDPRAVSLVGLIGFLVLATLCVGIVTRIAGHYRGVPEAGRRSRLWEIASAAVEVDRWEASTWLSASAYTVVATALFLWQRILIAQALGIDVPFLSYSAVIAMTGLLCLIPVSVQGIGTRDAALVVLLQPEGVSAEDALAISTLILLSILVNSFVGLLTVVWSKPGSGPRPVVENSRKRRPSPKEPKRAMVSAAMNFVYWPLSVRMAAPPASFRTTRRYIFTIGTGRFGSTFLTDYFNANIPRCLAVHEPNHMLKILSNRFASGEIAAGTMRLYLRSWAASREKMLRDNNLDLYVQNDPWLFGFTELLDDVFGEPRVIHIVRNPLTYIPSYLNRYYRESWTGFLRDAIPYWRLRGDKTGDFSREEWKAAAPETKIAWNWLKINRFIHERRSSVKHYLLLKYEDLYRGEREGLKKLMEFCGLDFKMSDAREAGLERNEVVVRKYGSAAEWSPELRARVIEICKPLMDEYGYKH